MVQLRKSYSTTIVELAKCLKTYALGYQGSGSHEKSRLSMEFWKIVNVPMGEKAMMKINDSLHTKKCFYSVLHTLITISTHFGKVLC